MMIEYKARKKGGRARGGCRDQGRFVHAVPDENYPSWTPALCGTKPGVKSAGWNDPTSSPVNCAKCLSFIKKQAENE